MKITVISNAKELRARMAEFRKVVGQDIRESLKAHARVACVYLASRTQPWGDGDKPRKQGEGAVLRDINKVYYTEKSEALLNQVTSTAIRWYEAQKARATKRDTRALMEKRFSDVKPRKDKSELIRSFKARFERYQQSGNTTAIGQIVRDMKFKRVLFNEFDSSHHKRSRDPRDGTVKGNRVEKVLVLGADGELQAYKDRVFDRVGLTKAGWAACAEAIPISGRVSVNTRGIPQWVTRHLGRASGRIVDGSSHPTAPGVRMTNATPWASEVIPPKEAQKALDEAGKSYLTYMNTAILQTLNKTYELKSA